MSGGREKSGRVIGSAARTDDRLLAAQVPHPTSSSIAVEVELTLKSRLRLTEIITALTEEYDEVWYFVPERLERTLAEVKSNAPRQNIRIQRYQPAGLTESRDPWAADSA